MLTSSYFPAISDMNSVASSLPTVQGGIHFAVLLGKVLFRRVDTICGGETMILCRTIGEELSPSKVLVLLLELRVVAY